MPKLPVISGKVLLKTLQKHGCAAIRQRGSHVFIEDVTRTKGSVIPIHGNEDLRKGTLKSILNDLDISVEELIWML